MNGVRAKAKAAEGIAGAVERGGEAWRSIGADGGEGEGGGEGGGGVAHNRCWVGFGAGAWVF